MSQYFLFSQALPRGIVRLCILCFVLVSSFHANAGLISSILKGAKKVEVPDGTLKNLNDISFSQIGIDLPYKSKPEILSLKLDLNNQWVLRDLDGNIVPDVSSLKNPVLVIEKFNLPDNLSQLKTFPPDLPILVRSERNFYEIKRGQGISIQTGSVVMKTDTLEALKKALYHLDTPWLTNKVHVVGAPLKDNHLGSAIHSMSVNTLNTSPSLLRGQTLVIGGPIRGDQILVAGETLSLATLRKLAKNYDVSLVLLDSRKAVSPEKIKTRMLKMNEEGKETTGAFLSNFNQSANKTFFQWHPDGKNFVLIQKEKKLAKQKKPAQNKTTKDPASSINISKDILLPSLIIYRPNEAHREELQRRWVWWLPSDVSLYLVLSAFAGFICFGTSRRLLHKIWRRKKRSEFAHALFYYLNKTLRLLVLLVIVIPVFGLPCLIFNIFYSVYLFFKLMLMALLKFLGLFRPKPKN